MLKQVLFHEDYHLKTSHSLWFAYCCFKLTQESNLKPLSNKEVVARIVMPTVNIMKTKIHNKLKHTSILFIVIKKNLLKFGNNLPLHFAETTGTN